MASLLEKSFPASVNVVQAVSMIERSGYQMEFRADWLEKMSSGDPFSHP